MKKIRLSDVVAFCSAVMRIMGRMQASSMRIRITRLRMRMRISVLSYACKNIVANRKPCHKNNPSGVE
nr:MAG TPA: hypothetical protein [Caudoviricetes sp.]